MQNDADIEVSHSPSGPGAGPSRDAHTRPAELPGLVSRVPGLALTLAIAVPATVAGKLLPVIGGPVAGMVIGVFLAALCKPGPRLRPGISTASKTVLQIAVVLLGSQLSLSRILEVGAGSLPVMVASLAACLFAAHMIGRRLGIGGDLRTLIGVGTGICGASAIAAVTPVIGAASAEVAYAVSTIFVFNAAAVLIFPALGHLLGMGPHAFGLFAGTAINDTSSVVAAAATYGSSAADHAVVVKLTRTLMIVPICMGLAALAVRRARTLGAVPFSPRIRLARLVPWFLIAFLLTATANSIGLIPANAHRGFSELSVFLTTVALAGIGLSTDLAGLRRTGPRPLLLGACLWGTVSLSSLALQYAIGPL